MNGHILSSAQQLKLIDIDPNGNGGTGSSRIVLNLNGIIDGVAVSPDGLVIYGRIGSAIRGYDIATGTQVFYSGQLDNGPDGIAVIISNNDLNGQMIVNFQGNGVKLTCTGHQT